MDIVVELVFIDDNLSGQIEYHIDHGNSWVGEECISTCNADLVDKYNFSDYISTHVKKEELGYSQEGNSCTSMGNRDLSGVSRLHLKTSTQDGNTQNHMLKYSDKKANKYKVFSKPFKITASVKSHTKSMEQSFTDNSYQVAANNCNSQHSIHRGRKIHNCEICGKSFNCITHMRRHIRSHTGEKPFPCNLCDKNFVDKSHLKRHLRTHTGEKPYPCKICDKQFSSSSNLNRHLTTHTGEKPYQCNLCGKQLSVRSSLKKHIATHFGEKPYYCHICHKHFSQGSNLKKHLLIHSGEKPHKCSFCDRRYADGSNLRRHVMTHSDQKLH